MKRLLMLTFILVLPACIPTAQTESELVAAPAATKTAVFTPTAPSTDIADLLQNRPESGVTIEIDAFFSGVNPAIIPTPEEVREGPSCPAFPTNHVLADEPMLPWLYVVNSMRSNYLQETMPWLLAVDPDDNNFGTPMLPYYGRIRGHLDDPAFANCQYADRMFVVEEVVAVYAEEPPDKAGWLQVPADFAEWPRHVDAVQGFDVAYPPDWTVEPFAEDAVLEAIIIRSPEKSDHPVIIRVHDGETHPDQYVPATEPPLLKGAGMSRFEQSGILEEWPESQNLPGFVIERETGPDEDHKAVLFNGNGRTYEITLTYPTGFYASQKLLNEFTAIVQSFRLHQS